MKMIKKFSNYFLRTILIITPFITITVLSSCQNVDCVGCYDEAPWSAPGQTVCYPEKDTCEQELGVNCYKCD